MPQRSSRDFRRASAALGVSLQQAQVLGEAVFPVFDISGSLTSSHIFSVGRVGVSNSATIAAIFCPPGGALSRMRFWFTLGVDGIMWISSDLDPDTFAGGVVIPAIANVDDVTAGSNAIAPQPTSVAVAQLARNQSLRLFTATSVASTATWQIPGGRVRIPANTYLRPSEAIKLHGLDGGTSKGSAIVFATEGTGAAQLFAFGELDYREPAF